MPFAIQIVIRPAALDTFENDFCLMRVVKMSKPPGARIRRMPCNNPAGLFRMCSKTSPKRQNRTSLSGNVTTGHWLMEQRLTETKSGVKRFFNN